MNRNVLPFNTFTLARARDQAMEQQHRNNARSGNAIAAYQRRQAIRRRKRNNNNRARCPNINETQQVVPTYVLLPGKGKVALRPNRTNKNNNKTNNKPQTMMTPTTTMTTPHATAVWWPRTIEVDTSHQDSVPSSVTLNPFVQDDDDVVSVLDDNPDHDDLEYLPQPILSVLRFVLDDLDDGEYKDNGDNDSSLTDDEDYSFATQPGMADAFMGTFPIMLG